MKRNSVYNFFWKSAWIQRVEENPTYSKLPRTLEWRSSFQGHWVLNWKVYLLYEDEFNFNVFNMAHTNEILFQDEPEGGEKFEYVGNAHKYVVKYQIEIL